MFELDSSRTHVETASDQVFDIYTSINRPTVAPPGRTPEPAQSYVATVYNQGKYDVFIYLYLDASNEGLLYQWSEGPVPGDQVPGLYQSALEFNESMGFMMDDLHYRDKGPEEKELAFAEVPMFHADLSFMKPEEEGTSEELVIEPIEGEPAAEEETEEINLDVLGESEELKPLPEPEAAAEEVIEITLDDSEVMLEKPEAVELEGADEPGEEQLLDSLVADAEAEGEDLSITMEEPTDEQTIEAAPFAEAVIEKKPAKVEVEQELLTSEEEDVLGSMEEEEAASIEEEAGDDIEEIMIGALEPEAPPPPSKAAAKISPAPAVLEEPESVSLEVDEEEEEISPPPLLKKPRAAPPSPAAMKAAPESGPAAGGPTDHDFKMLVRFLAMM